MSNTTPNIGLHVTLADETRNYQAVRLEQSGDHEGSNMIVIDREVGALKVWKETHVVFSPTEPGNQKEGDVWHEIIP